MSDRLTRRAVTRQGEFERQLDPFFTTSLLVVETPHPTCHFPPENWNKSIFTTLLTGLVHKLALHIPPHSVMKAPQALNIIITTTENSKTIH